MKRVIAFSLWGSNPKYCVGSVKNASLAKEFYPGWECWFYCGKSVPTETLQSLRESGSRVIVKEEEGDWTGMFWRFEPIADPEVEVMISRDADSRLSNREAKAVNEWLETEKLFHVMRDHPAHSIEILGGMWGARRPILGDMIHLMRAYTKGNFWQVDQNFLKEVVWPRVAYSTYTNDEFFAKAPFPVKRQGDEFIGQVYDENDVPNSEYAASLRAATGR
jgi:hypothetical protein